MRYRIQNLRIEDKSRSWWEGEADSSLEACKKANWEPYNCWVRQKTESSGWGKPVDLPILGVKDRSTLTSEEMAELSKSGPDDKPKAKEHSSDAKQPDEVLSREEKDKLQKVKETHLEQMRPGDMSQAEKDAFEHRLHIMQLARAAQATFLEMGELLYNARESAEWSILHYEAFKDYIEDLKLPMQNSYSWATRLIGIFEYLVKKMNLSEVLLMAIGVAKLTRLLPAARNGTLTMELIEQAKELSDLDLRILLGHNVGGGGGDDDSSIICCPRCGQQIMGAKWSHGPPPRASAPPGPAK